MEIPTNSSFSDSPNETATSHVKQLVDEMAAYPSWDFSFSEKGPLVLLLVFICSAILSLTANGLLIFFTTRYKQQLWEAQYILIKNIAVCGFGLNFWSAFFVSRSIVQKQAQFFGGWCIMQFSILRLLFLTSQVTLALMAVERYIFVCHSIQYHRMMNTVFARMSLGVIWLISGALSVHGGLVLNGMKSSFHHQTSGLLCSAVTIKELITFSHYEDLCIFGGPYLILIVCILTVFFCYGCMYKTALNVSKALKCSNLRATCTVGLYLLMFFLQMVPNIFFIILTVVGKAKYPSLRLITPLLTPVLIMIPSSIQATFFLIRNPQIRELLISVCCFKCNVKKGKRFRRGVRHPCQMKDTRPDVSSSLISHFAVPARFDPLNDQNPTCIIIPLEEFVKK